MCHTFTHLKTNININTKPRNDSKFEILTAPPKTKNLHVLTPLKLLSALIDVQPTYNQLCGNSPALLSVRYFLAALSIGGLSGLSNSRPIATATSRHTLPRQ